MNKKSFLLIATLFALLSSGALAQSSLIMNDSAVFLSSSDTVATGGSVTFTGQVINESSQTHNSPIGIVVAIDTMGTQGTDTANFIYLSFDYLSAASNVIIAPGDTIWFIDTLVIGGAFKNGINTVVIWPVTSMPGYGPPRDSAKFNVFVFDPLTINNEEVIDQLILCPNPFSEKVWFLTKGDVIVEEVRIIDALGKIILSNKIRNNQFVETGNLPQGIYFIELSYNNGLKKRIRTIKQ